jgi:hypothetical protein
MKEDYEEIKEAREAMKELKEELGNFRKSIKIER